MPITLLLVGILALGVRLAAWSLEPVVSRDGVRYIQLAEALHAAGGSFDKLASAQGEYVQSPFFVAILASHVSGASPHVIGVVMNVLLGSFFPVLIYMIISQLDDKPAIAITGALFAALHPVLINYSIEVQREMGYLFFAGWFFYFLIRALKRKQWYCSYCTGAAAITAFFFRYEGAELYCFAGMVYVAVCFMKSVPWKVLILHLLLFVLGTTLTAMAILQASQKSPADWCRESSNKISAYLKF